MQVKAWNNLSPSVHWVAHNCRIVCSAIQIGTFWGVFCLKIICYNQIEIELINFSESEIENLKKNQIDFINLILITSSWKCRYRIQRGITQGCKKDMNYIGGSRGLQPPLSNFKNKTE